MRKITDIYQKYNIMPNLALHQFRVAGVAMQICESIDIPIDINAVVTACLLHDMGNIIKFDLRYTEREFPEFFAEKGFEYWKSIQDEYIEKYGKDEYPATIEIAKELKLSDEQIGFINVIITHLVKEDPTYLDGKLTSCICKYADMRSGPKGVISLKSRLEEWQKRNDEITFEYMQNTYDIFHKIENTIFSYSKIKPEDITEESTTAYIEKLKNFTL